MRNGNENTPGFSALLLLTVCVILLLAFSAKKCPALGKPPQHTNLDPLRLNEVKPKTPDPNAPAYAGQWLHPRSEERLSERQQMADVIHRYYGLNATKVLDAITAVPRHWFVPADRQAQAYFDSPLPIGEGQTISQPYIVAYMTSLLALDETKNVLEIGTGSGYQAALLTEFTPHVYTIEIVKPLGKAARKLLTERGYTTVQVKIGDGYKGWPEQTPFDAIIVTCAPDHIPPDLLKQLKVGGKMVIPVGGVYHIQELILVTKDADGRIHKESKMPVRFVPLTRDKND